MTIYLIRHCHAGSRSGFAGHDFDRPLTPKGMLQAAHLEHRLASVAVDVVYSSAFHRCVETVADIALSHELKVKERRELLEGADVTATLALIESCAGTHAVMCSHGDVIPKVLRRLSSAGMKSEAANLAAKGSMWILDTTPDGRVVAGRYEPPSIDDD